MVVVLGQTIGWRLVQDEQFNPGPGLHTKDTGVAEDTLSVAQFPKMMDTPLPALAIGGGVCVTVTVCVLIQPCLSDTLTV